MATIVELLQRRAERRATDRAFVFRDDAAGHNEGRDEVAVSYAELDSAARRVAAAVGARDAAGRPVLLLYPPGRGYVEGFLGCLYAGAIAVPAYPPDPARLARTLPRLRALIADCGARLALGTSDLLGAVPALVAEAPELAALDWIATDTLSGDETSWTPPRRASDSPALLQYTSGSTAAPRGVLLSHANLLHNAALVHIGFGTSPDDIAVSWLPPYHDMGLIGGIVQPIYAGLPAVLMSPLAFLQRPLVWLETVSRFGATISGGPNFAFDLCVRKSTPAQRASLDLSRWAVAFCGAEPVRAASLDRFAAAFGCAGFRREAFYPCYGLAEATLIVTGGRRSAPPRLIRHGDAVHVACGAALGDQRVVVVDPSTGAAGPPDTVGEIWVGGGSVGEGYWQRPAETAQTFQASRTDDSDGRRYLRTGDLGLLTADGELVITGRIKDLIVVRGRNVYPQDLEHAVEERVAEVRPGCTAAFPVEVAGEERVAIACEVSGGAPATGVVAAIRRVLAEVAEVSPAAVVLLRPRTIPKTSSGKIQRHACRRAFLDGELAAGGTDVVARWDEVARRDEVARWDEAAGWDEAARDDGQGSLTAAIAGVLGLPGHEVDPNAPLTALGLDSLRAVELRHVLDERSGLDVSLSQLLAGITAAELADRVASSADAEPEPEAVGAENGVSDGQRALWFLQRWAPDSPAYQITRAARIGSPLDPDALDRAFQALTRRHPALRTCLPSVQGEPVARVSDRDGPVLERHDVAELGEEALRQRVRREARRRLDLERGPLFRASLYSRGPADHVLLLSVHHAVSDFWSLSVLADDLLALYQAELAGAPARLPELSPVTTAAVGDIDARLDYWRATLADAPTALELPTTRPRPRVQSFRGATHTFRVDEATLRALDAVARRAGVTRFMTLLAGFAALLARYAGEDLVIGMPTAGRDDRRTAHAVGYFVNPVPLRITVAPGTPFRMLLDQVRRSVLGALDHVVPFPRLVQAVQPARDPGRSPITQVVLALQQAPPGRPDFAAFAVADDTARLSLGGLLVQPYRVDEHGTAFDLSLTMAEVDGGLTGSLEYGADLFDEPTVARLARQFTTLLTHAVRAPDEPVETLELMDEAERAAVLALADGGPAETGGPHTLHDLFALQATRRPDAAAVVAGDRVLSYAELDRRANRLAVLLRRTFGVRRGDVVCGYLPRHEDATVAFWAALKAGGGYLALEPNLPARRLEWMIADARPAVLLSHRTMADQLPAGGRGLCLCLDEPWPATVAAMATGESAGDTGTGPDDLAYVMYTSGSTGRPKGVLVPHRGGGNIARAVITAVGLTERDRLLQYASCAYDVSVLEILMAHLNGATLVIPPPEAAVPGQELVRLLTEQRVTALMMAPSALAALPDAELPGLTRLLTGGEALPAELVARWAPGRRFVDVYGPTEATIGATVAVCRHGQTRSSIGRPIPGAYTYVLDERMRPVPVGVPGELYLGGAGIARGYLNRADLTAERFLPDPFGPVPGARLYRTGDRARWLPDGTLAFLGRLDDQVKVRGTRVEPGEVEARLRELLGAREVAVVSRQAPNGGTELVAYLAVSSVSSVSAVSAAAAVFAVAGEQRPSVAELRALLRAELPEQWVPAAFVYLDALPLNTSHKLDRRALPPPTAADRGRSGWLAPRTELERAVARVWAAVLGVSQVGVRDHFFDELGGTSLLVAKVTSELRGRLGVDVPVTHLFEHPTVEALAQRLDRDGRPDTGAADPAEDHADDQADDQAAARRAALARRRSPP